MPAPDPALAHETVPTLVALARLRARLRQAREAAASLAWGAVVDQVTVLEDEVAAVQREMQAELHQIRVHGPIDAAGPLAWSVKAILAAAPRPAVAGRPRRDPFTLKVANQRHRLLLAERYGLLVGGAPAARDRWWQACRAAGRPFVAAVLHGPTVTLQWDGAPAGLSHLSVAMVTTLPAQLDAVTSYRRYRLTGPCAGRVYGVPVAQAYAAAETIRAFLTTAAGTTPAPGGVAS